MDQSSSSLPFTEFTFSLSYDRLYDNTERFSIGFDEEMDVVEGFKQTWDHFARFNILPPL